MKPEGKGSKGGVLDYAGIFYQSFLNSSDAIMISDADSRILFVNDAFTELYGYKEKELLGKYASVVRHSETTDDVFASMWRDIGDPEKGFWRGELRNRRKNGTTVEVVLTITTIRNEQGEIVAHLSNAQDITEKKQIEKTLIQQEKLFSTGLLASGIAHEIGSPLNVISGRAEMIRGRMDGQNPDLVKSLEIIIQQTDRIGELVQALLNFSRPTGEHTPSTFEVVDLKTVVEECGKLFHKPLKDQGVTFAIHCKTPTTVIWNFFKSEQIFVNLIQNALHAVEEIRSPEISIQFRETTKEELRRLPDDHTNALAVIFRDNGSGIQPEHLNRVFDPFFTTKDVGMGTGLGLSVVYGLVEEVQGHVSVDSTLGQGTEFRLFIPRTAD